jgi:hypothetical protein
MKTIFFGCVIMRKCRDAVNYEKFCGMLEKNQYLMKHYHISGIFFHFKFIPDFSIFPLLSDEKKRRKKNENENNVFFNFIIQ